MQSFSCLSSVAASRYRSTRKLRAAEPVEWLRRLESKHLRCEISSKGREEAVKERTAISHNPSLVAVELTSSATAQAGVDLLASAQATIHFFTNSLETSTHMLRIFKEGSIKTRTRQYNLQPS